MNLLSTLNPTDLDAYAHLPRSVKDEAADWFAMLADASAAPRSHAQTLHALFKRHAARLGKSVAQCTRKYYEWQNGTGLYPAGDWRILINRRKAGPAWYSSLALDHAHARALPPAFVDHLRSLFGSNQRAKCETQYRELLRQWNRWRKGDTSAAIPGYGHCPEPDPSCLRAHEHPRGWSYRNLIRYRQPRVELALETLGTAAALKLLPPVPRTREGARFLEYVFFDDVWLDRKCIVPGYRDPARILQLGCLDFASGVYLKFGQRPELPADDGTRERLKERDMKWLVAVLLEEFGYPAEYDMHLIVERGTATLREPDARALADLSGGRIKVCRTSMEGKLVLSWDERSTGNPRGKGPLESWHNLLHNESAAIPGQLGKDRDHCPAELFGREKEAVNLHAASLIMTDQQRSRLRLPFPTKDQAHLQTLEIIHRINNRTDHDLDSFDSIILWRLKGTQMEWRPESELTSLAPDPAHDLAHLLEFVTRKESPIERMSRLRSGLRFTKFPASELCRFYEDSHVTITLKEPSTVIEFRRDGKPRRYVAQISKSAVSQASEPAGPEAPRSTLDAPDAPTFLPPGEYLAYIRPDDSSAIHLTRAGAYVATWHLEDKVRPGDTAALARAIQKKTGLLNHHLGNVRRRNAGMLAAREADLKTNLTLLAEAGLLGMDASSTGMENPAGDEEGTHALAPDPAHARSALSAAVAEHAQRKENIREHQRAEAQLADLADEALLANIQPELD